MIAQIKVTKNAKEIEEAQKEVQKVMQENAEIEKSNAQTSKAKRHDLKPMPNVPQPEFGGSDICLRSELITLAFVNSNGEISIKYNGDNFNLIFNDIIWSEIKKLFN